MTTDSRLTRAAAAGRDMKQNAGASRASALDFPRDMTKSAIAWLPACIFFLALSFDFRAEEAGGSAVQYLLVSLSMAAAAVGSFSLIRNRHGRWFLPVPALLVLYLVVFSVGTGLLRLNPYFDLLRALVPYLLFFFGALLAEATVRRLPQIESRVLTAIFVCGLLSCAWTYFYATQIRGVVLIEGRHQFVSLAAPQIFSLGLLAIAFGLPQKRWAQVTIVVVGILFAFSVTRAYMLMGIVALAYLAWVSSARWMSWRNKSAAGIALGVIVLSLVALFIFAPEYFDRWVDRLFYERLDSGEVTTVVAREAEFKGQMDAWGASLNTMIFGRGVGTRFFLDEKILSKISDYQGHIEYLEGASYAGHSYWIGTFTAGGFATGWVMPLVLLLALVLNFDALIKLRKLLRETRANEQALWHSAMGATYMAAVLAMFSMSFSTNPMGERFTCALFGFCLVASRAHLTRAVAYASNASANAR